MTDDRYPRDRTALLFVDPYNDFLSEGGKLWPHVRAIADEVGLLDNLRAVTTAIRGVGIPTFIVPHHRWEPGDYERLGPPDPVSGGVRQGADLRQGQLGRGVAP